MILIRAGEDIYGQIDIDSEQNRQLLEAGLTGHEVTARLVGLDTAETKTPGCDAELAHGRRATLRLRQLVAGGEVEMKRKGDDRYGRVLVVLTVDGVDVADTLVLEGLAVPYSGGKRINWCERLGSG